MPIFGHVFRLLAGVAGDVGRVEGEKRLEFDVKIGGCALDARYDGVNVLVYVLLEFISRHFRRPGLCGVEHRLVRKDVLLISLKNEGDACMT